MKELSKFELAAIKRSSKNVAINRKKLQKLQEKINKLQEEAAFEKDFIQRQSDPYRHIIGSSDVDIWLEKYLNGTLEEEPVSESDEEVGDTSPLHKVEESYDEEPQEEQQQDDSEESEDSDEDYGF